jgi:hypothetical protein
MLSLWAGQASAMSKRQSAEELIESMAVDCSKIISELHKQQT